MFSFIGILFVTSCKKEINNNPTPEPEKEGFEAIIVPDGFNWSTIKKSGFDVQIVDASGNPSAALNGYPLDATDLTGNLLQRSSIIDGKAKFYLELNNAITQVRLYSPSHLIEYVLDLTGSDFSFPIPETLKSVKQYADSDGDGVFDDFDQFPDDAGKAYMAYYPSPYNRGTGFKSGDDEVEVWYYQMFEDLWPAKGDYDLNDLILKLRMITYFDAQSKWVGGTFDFYIWTNGANMHLGCGMEFVNYLSNVEEKLELEYLSPGQLTLDPGTYNPAYTMLDPDVANAVIIFNDVDDVKSSDYWNTGVAGSADPMLNHIEFGYSVAPPTFWMAGYLYLFRTDDRSHEVRPIGFPPTTAANMALLGTNKDNSPTTWDWTPGTTFLYPLDPPFYATESLHPWGIELEFAGDLAVPFENVSIIDAFPQFVSWAESGGTTNTTWYEFPSADPTKVFNVANLIAP